MSNRDPSPPFFRHRTSNNGSPRASRSKEAKRSKTFPGLARASSSLNILPGIEGFRTFEESSDNAIQGETLDPSSPEVPVTPVRRTDHHEHLNNLIEGIGSAVAEPRVSTDSNPHELLDSATTSKNPREVKNIRREKSQSFATGFYGNIHRAYHRSLRELDHFFGELKPEELPPQTMREVCHIELLHLLALGTDDPMIYRSCIQKAHDVCRAMKDREVATIAFNKTNHLMYEMEEFMEHHVKPVAQNHGNSRAESLPTIAEEEDGQSEDKHESGGAANSKNPHVAENQHISHRHATTGQPPQTSEEDPVEAAYTIYIEELRADAMRRKAATDHYIERLKHDLMQRKLATDNYIAELAGKSRAQYNGSVG